jgi:biopolymer transport protein ExbD
MSKFKKKIATKQEIPTAALPDIIFMLLFFFMVTTVMRETEIMVEQKIPRATQLKKLEKKSLVSHLYVGKPKRVEQFGVEPRIQANDAFITPDDLILWVQQEKDKLSESDRDKIWVSLKVDHESKMGIISDVQEKLRESNARKVLYNVVQASE